MGVALSVRLDKLDSLKCSTCNTVDNGNSVSGSRNSEAFKILSSDARGTLANKRDKSISCKGGPYQQFYATWEGHLPPLP